jgi:DNA-binding transcriptional LysR family regulator
MLAHQAEPSEGRMDAADLRVFEAVARLGSMNRAAAELNTVQSNVTTRIRLLEAELQTRLFDRRTRGVSPTAAGHRLLPYARRIGQLLRDARSAAVDDGTPKGRLTVGSLESTAALRLSPVLSAYAARHPGVDLVLKTGTSGELVEAVLAQQLEGAFVCGPIDHPELAAEAIVAEELVMLTAAAAMELDAELRRDDLKIVVLRAGCSYRQRLEEVLARRGAVAFRCLEFGTLDAIFACVAAGIGITLLPRALVGADRPVAAHALPAAEARVDTVFIRRRDAFVSSALAAFVAMARPTPARVRAAE